MFFNVVKTMKFKTNLVLWTCLVVAYGFMESLENRQWTNSGNQAFFQGVNNSDLLQTHGPYRRHSKQRMSTKNC